MSATLRALITAVVVLVSPLAEGQSVAPRPRWRAVVVSPQPEFPAVTVDLGYPLPYIPPHNAPITLHATAGDRPFDGYIGFHFELQGDRTVDTPVIARAVLRPHESWTFSTFVTLRGRGAVLNPREIAIEWRDASMKVKAVRSAGIPSWNRQLMPLSLGAASALGGPAYEERPEALPDRAQWYAGFSSMVTPLAVWLDLPKGVREAAFGSGLHVVFFGTPRSGQQLDAIDRALVPVNFESKPGSYRLQWPYGNSTVATPISWSVKNGSHAVGGGPMPYIVRSAVSTWAADASAITLSLPAADVIPLDVHEARERTSFHPKAELSVAWPRPAQLLRTYPAALLTIAAALLSIGGWLVLRRGPRPAVTIALLISAILVLSVRDRIRPSSGAYRYELSSVIAPGVVDIAHFVRTYGPSVIPARDGGELLRTSVNGGVEWMEDAEVRNSDTPVSMGVMVGVDHWNRVPTWSRRRTVAEGPHIRVQRREGDTLVLDYDSDMPVHYVGAEWLCGQSFCSGAAATGHRARGTVTIRNARLTWRDSESFYSGAGESIVADRAIRASSFASRGSVTRVLLIHKARTSTRAVRWFQPYDQRPSGAFLITDREAMLTDSGTFTFALPADLSPSATARVSVKVNKPSSRVSLTWATGSRELLPTGSAGIVSATRSYVVPPDVLQEIVATGGMVRVQTSPQDLVVAFNPYEIVSIEIREKKP